MGATSSSEIVFTSSGTEANQLAIRGVLERELSRGRKPRWLLAAGAHESVHAIAEWLARQGGEAIHVPIDEEGRVLLPALEECLARFDDPPVLLSVNWVNNETGVIADVSAVARLAHAKGVPLHLDAAQAWGKIPIDAARTGAALLTLSGHKVGAPAGIGAVWIRSGISLEALISGKQEAGRRGGTENLLGCIALGAAAASVRPDEWAARVAPLRERLERSVLALIPGARVNGAGAPRAANTSSFSFAGIEKDGLVSLLDLEGFAVSAGAACSSGVQEPSRVLMAMGRAPGQARAAIRVSLADALDWEELERFAGALARSVGRLRDSGIRLDFEAKPGKVGG